MGGEISRRKDFSEETARELEEQVSQILRDSYEECEKIVDEHWAAVEAVAAALLAQETIDGQVIEEAYRMSSEDSKSAEEITEWIIGRAKAAEEKLAAEAPTIEEKEPEAKRRSEPERPPANPQPRPAES